MYQKWPHQIFPTVNFVSSHDGHFGLGRARFGGAPPPPLCDIPTGRCFSTGPWTVTPSSLRVLRRVVAFCRPLRPVLQLVSFPRSRSPVVGVLGLCWLRGPVIWGSPPPPLWFSIVLKTPWRRTGPLYELQSRPALRARAHWTSAPAQSGIAPPLQRHFGPRPGPAKSPGLAPVKNNVLVTNLRRRWSRWRRWCAALYCGCSSGKGKMACRSLPLQTNRAAKLVCMRQENTH